MRANGGQRPLESVLLIRAATGCVTVLWYPAIRIEAVRRRLQEAPTEHVGMYRLTEAPHRVMGVKCEARYIPAVFRSIGELWGGLEPMEAALWGGLADLESAPGRGAAMVAWGKYWEEAARAAGALLIS